MRPSIDVLEVWRQGVTGEGVIVTVVDSGMDRNSIEFKNNYVCFSVLEHLLLVVVFSLYK